MSIDDNYAPYRNRIIEQVAKAKIALPPSILPVGEHRVAIERVDVRESQRRGAMVVATMRVFGPGPEVWPLRSLGECYEWPWFIESDAYGYAEARCKEFLIAALGATGEPTDNDAIARCNVTENPEHFLGVVMDASVTEKAPRHTKGTKVKQATWTSQWTPEYERWRIQVLLRPELAREVGLRAEARALELSGITGAESAQHHASKCMELFAWCLARELPEAAGRSV